jgi:NAD-dependent deacetylase
MDQLMRLLDGKRRVAALTGAGISAESGVPTFRGAEGLWRNFRPEEIACMDAFLRDPVMVWEWYLMRRRTVAAVAPNAAHALLARWERDFPEFTLITQNVDGLHGRAGSTKLIELHGNLWTARCMACGSISRDEAVSYPALPPRCSCGGMIRPHIVWFGESLDPEDINAAFDAAASAEVFFVVGTSSLVYPAAALPHAALEAGAAVIEVNPDETPLTPRATRSFRMKAVEFAQGVGSHLHF